ncbi:TIM-barrel domain-containing protein [Mucilaginibacter sp. CSA2-8R]|uniref:glycoside hydrolase family 31 protein n=1 Tax=Mucilaginibacter sp. CSA2-8R TaxID=3141542 RepID=UPI00315CB9F5
MYHKLHLKAIALQRLFVLILFAFVVLSASASASVRSFQKEADGVTFILNNGIMKIKICRADIIQVRYSMLKALPAFNSLVVNGPFNAPIKFTVAQTAQQVLINTGKIILKVDRASNAIAYYTLAGQLITSEDQENNKQMAAQTVAGINTYSCSTQFASPVNEGLYGLGCHPLDTLSINYKGRNQDMAIKYLTGAIPVLLSTRGYGILWDNYSASQFYGAEGGNTKFKYVSESGKQVNYYFFYGPDFDQIINAYRTATGKAPMFPKWSFGLFQSQDRYMSQDEIISVKNKYRNSNIPVDAIVQDWYYWDPLPIGSHVMKPERYPNPKALVDELHKANIHAMISIWPVFGQGTPNYDALKRTGGLTSITWDNVVTHTFDTYYDAHSPQARNLYWQQARDSLVKRYGWDAWWVDQCEPDNGALLDERRKADFWPGKGIDYFNTYSLEHTKGLYRGWRNDIANKRAFFLVRQAFAGQQRNATTLWSSDITCTFDAFKSQVPQGINACASGIPYWTSDIGGYHLGWKAANWSLPENQELFTRWFQFGVFSPIFRIHGKGERALFSNNWSAETKATLLNYDKLRYRLLPYIYSLAGQVTQNNYTIMRALPFDFRQDEKVYSIPNEYMFGPAFLVNPVTEQLYTGSNAATGKHTRTVYLPVAKGWYDFWTGKHYNGGQQLNVDVPLSLIPLYVRAGSIVPMGPVMQYATEKPANELELRIYPGANGKFEFYEDENDNYNYEKGRYAKFILNWNDQKHQLTISATQGNFKGMLKSRKFNVVLVKEGYGTNVDAGTRFNTSVTYTGKPLAVTVN